MRYPEQRHGGDRREPFEEGGAVAIEPCSDEIIKEAVQQRVHDSGCMPTSEQATAFPLDDCEMENIREQTQTAGGNERQLAVQVVDLEHLHALGTRLMKQDDLESVLREVMGAAKDMLHADKATVQLWVDGRLKLIGAIGWPQAFLDRFQFVDESGISTCAAALRTREHVIAQDFDSDPRFTELAAVAAPYGARAAISTPLLAEDGSIAAMFTLYFDQPWHPRGHALRMLDLYVHQAMVQVQHARTSAFLRESVRFGHALRESSVDCIKVLDLQGRIMSMNGPGYRLLELDQDAPIEGRFWHELLDSNCRAVVEAAVTRAAAGTPQVFEMFAPTAKGKPKWWESTMTAVPDDQGRPERLVVFSRDITARKQTELERVASLAREREAREEAEILVESARLFSGELEHDELVQKLTDLATRLTGAQYGSFFYNQINDKGESYMLYTLSGADMKDFEDMPMPRNTPLFQPTFAGAGVVRCGDVCKHPDFGKEGPYHGMPEGHLPVRSYLAVPVKSRNGTVHGGLFFAHSECDVFDERAERLVQGIAAQAAIALDNVQIYRKIAESEARFRQMIDALPMPVYTTNAEGRLTHFNPACVEFAGRTPLTGIDEWSVGWKLYRADGSSLPHEQSPMAVAMKRGRPSFGNIELMAERPDGTLSWFTPYPTPLHDEHGRLIGGINMLVDITERKRQERALVDAHLRAESQRRLYEAILDNTPDLAYIFDLDHRFIYANDMLLKTWGKSWPEAAGKTCLELGYPEWAADKLDRAVERVIATKQPVRGQAPFGERMHEYIFVPVVGPEGDVEAVAGTNRDITDQKEIERSLRTDEERKAFLLDLADKLRNTQEPQHVQKVACRALAERLQCDRVHFSEIREDEGVSIVLPDYHRTGLPSLSGRHPLAGMEELIELLRDGKPLVINDIVTSPLLPPSARERSAALGIRALLATLMVRRGKLAWSLSASTNQPREWKPEEVSLLTEVAERTWDAVQRAQALADLSRAREQAEQHARTLDSTMSSVLDMVFRYTPEGRFDFANHALLDMFGLSSEQVIGKTMAELGYAPETEQQIMRDLARVVETRAPVNGESWYTNPADRPGYFTYKLAPIFNAEREVTLVAGTALDITERKRNELLIVEQKNLLEMIATGCELPKCLQELTSSVSRLDSHTRAAVLLSDGSRRSFEEIHSTYVPASFGKGIEGAPINDLAIGTCGTAVFEGVPVSCSDIAHDEHWSLSWRDLCLTHDVRACHSTPIFTHGRATGSFFLAFDRVGEADEWHRRIAEFGAHVASIAISSQRAEIAVLQSEAELAQELADTRLLQGVSTELLSETDPDALYSRIVDAASALMRSDFASLQMFHPERGKTGELRLLAHRGFPDDAAKSWEWVTTDSGTTCAIALKKGKRIITKDVRDAVSLLGSDKVAAYERAGIRAVQTTPLFARNGKLVGMLSTHWREPHEPPARRMGLLEVLGRQAADLIEGRRAEQKLMEMNDFLERRVAERTAELERSEREVRRMASQLTMVEHAERRRISQILHDDLQQQLHSIQMKLHSARTALGRGEAAKILRHLDDAEQWSGEGVETARRLTVDLSPPILKSEGLAEALDWLVTQMREMHGLQVTVTGDRDLQLRDDAKRVLIYQTVRELLFNIVKHAGTDQARIELRRCDHTLELCVRDNGKGFDPDQLRNSSPRMAGGFGLTSAHERLHLLGGSINVDSAPGSGTEIVLQVPLRRTNGIAESPEYDHSA